MTSDRWDRLNRLVDEALARPEAEREAFLRESCHDDESLREEAWTLVRRADRADGFLDPPAVAATDSSDTDLNAGTQLGPYRIDAAVGRGGMGVVYRARDRKLRRTIAVKVLTKDALGGAEQRARFVREARAASALNHPNIVAIYDINLETGRDFIAMEFIAGAPLQRLIPPEGLAVDRALDLAMQIVRAMAAAHAGGLVHRDLKPANILVTPDGHVKVIDFGLAQLTQRASSNSTTFSSPTPDDTAIGGTPGYAAPEQVEGKTADARADVFGIGAVLYEMLTGRRAFEGTSTAATLAAVLHDTPRKISKLRRDVPRDLERLTARCLEKNPDARFGSANELLPLLQRVQAQTAARRVQLRLVLRRPAVVFGIIGLILAGSSYAAWSWQRQSRTRWVHETAIPRAEEFWNMQDFDSAFRLVQEAERILPDDGSLKAIKARVSITSNIVTTPAGAEVCVKGYRQPPDAEWLCLGTSPISGATIPRDFLRWRIRLAGYETLEGAFRDNFSGPFVLKPISETPAGMVFGLHYDYFTA